MKININITKHLTLKSLLLSALLAIACNTHAQEIGVTSTFSWSSFYAGYIHYYIITGHGVAVINYTRDSLEYISMTKKDPDNSASFPQYWLLQLQQGKITLREYNDLVAGEKALLELETKQKR